MAWFFNLFVKKLKYYINFSFNLIYKKNCCVCGSNDAENFLCKNCAKTIDFLGGFAQKKIEGVDVFCACKYEDVVKKLIQNYKFNNKMDIKCVLAGILADFFNNNFKEKNYTIVPIPSHPNRVSQRGYDHTKELAKEFAGRTGLKINTGVLKKIKDTKPQYAVRVGEREENVKDCFYVGLSNCDDNFLIIDDITTTGATLKWAVLKFKEQGINNLTCLALCKA